MNNPITNSTSVGGKISMFIMVGESFPYLGAGISTSNYSLTRNISNVGFVFHAMDTTLEEPHVDVINYYLRIHDHVHNYYLNKGDLKICPYSK